MPKLQVPRERSGAPFTQIQNRNWDSVNILLDLQLKLLQAVSAVHEEEVRVGQHVPFAAFWVLALPAGQELQKRATTDVRDIAATGQTHRLYTIKRRSYSRDGPGCTADTSPLAGSCCA